MKIQIINRRADYKSSMAILEELGLEPLTYQEALRELVNDKNLRESLKSKWFYLAGKGIDMKDGRYRIEDDGSFFRKGGNDVERTVYVSSGKYLLSLVVHSGDGAAQVGRRFSLGADDEPHDVAPVVVGKNLEKKEKGATTGRIK